MFLLILSSCGLHGSVHHRLGYLNLCPQLAALFGDVWKVWPCWRKHVCHLGMALRVRTLNHS